MVELIDSTDGPRCRSGRAAAGDGDVHEHRDGPDGPDGAMWSLGGVDAFVRLA
jgi:hypothetical protein